MRMDPICVAVGLLHDVLEDTLTTPERLQQYFGSDVLHIVEGVTKISQIPFATSEERQAETYRKMLLAMVDDIRVILVKLADRLHNMRTLQHLPEDRQKRIARETLDIYAPIAGRLGMAKIKNELEDLAFRYIDKPAYDALAQQVEDRRKQSAAFIEKIRGVVDQNLRAAGIEAQIEGRIKRLHSIQQKLRRQRIDLDQVYDFVALRILVDSVADCYAALGVLHNTWRPVPGRIKDFIAMPRPNGYQSLHTSVISEDGHPFEVQIRTQEMHRIAEEGIAGALEVQGGPHRRRQGRPRLLLAAPAARVAAGGQGPARVPELAEARPLSRGGLLLHAARRGEDAAARRLADRLRLRDPHRGRPPVRGRARQRQDGAAALQAEERRHRRDPDLAGPQAEPRLAELHGHEQGEGQDPHYLNTTEKQQALEIGRKHLERELRRYDLSLKKVLASRRRSRRWRRSSARARGSTTCSSRSATARSRCARCWRSSCRRRSSPSRRPPPSRSRWSTP
jgi:hypothetical protein